MDKAARLALLKHRYLSPSARSAPRPPGIAKAKLPPDPPARSGVTAPTNGQRVYNPFSLSLAPARVTWIEKPEPQPDPTIPRTKRRKGASPLVQIAKKRPGKLKRLRSGRDRTSLPRFRLEIGKLFITQGVTP